MRGYRKGQAGGNGFLRQSKNFAQVIMWDGGHSMPAERVYVYCDTCKRPVPTGLSIDPEALKTATIRNNVTVCAVCGSKNLWSKAELWPESLVPK
jgi:hypothetical protein